MNLPSTAKESFFRFTTTRPVAITMIVLGIMVFGLLSYNQLSMNLMPDITYPSITVRTEFAGSAPEEVETAISRPIEEQLGVVTSLVAISSISKPGQSDVILEFDWDTDMNEAIGEVREKLDLVFLPDGAEKPIILKYDPSLDPIIRLGLTGGPDLFFDRYVAEEQIKRALETVKGVASVKVKGGYEEEIRVDLDEQKISIMGLDIQQIRQRLAQENVNLAGGELKEGQTEYIVRTLNEFKTIPEISEINVGFQNGREVRLRDIGRVYRTFKERQLITRLNYRESVELEIYKEADANIVEVARSVRNKVFGTPAQQAFVRQLKQRQEQERQAQVARADTAKAEKPKDEKAPKPGPGQGRQAFQQEMLLRAMTDFIAYGLPGGMNIQQLTDQSVFIENSLNEVKNTAIMGGILAVIVLFLFLNHVPTTIIVGLSIPLSIIATFASMKLFNVSLNIMSLGGLALGIGMLVDNSIVVTESIFRCREEGDGFVESVVRGTSEVGAAVTASTLTTIAVFFPMVFVKGVAGQIFGDLALTVVFSLLASLGVALFFIPMLASRQFKMDFLKTAQDSPKKFFLKFAFIPDFWRSLKNLGKSFSQASLIKKILLLLLFPAWLFWILARLLLQLVFELLGKAATLLLIILGAALRLGGFLWKHVLSKIARFFVKLFDRGYAKVRDVYPFIIDWALGNKKAVLLLSVIPLLVCLFILLPRLGQELIPEVAQGEFNVELTLPIGTPVETTAEVITPIEQLILDEPEVEKISTVAGVDLTKVSDSESGQHTARITVTLKPSGNPAETERRVLGHIREKLRDFSGIAHKISRPVLFSFKTPIEVEIKGYNLASLTSLSRQAVQAISEIPGLTDVKSNLQRGSPEVQISYDRSKLAFYGLNILDVANIVRNKVLGEVATQFKREDRRIDIRVKVRDEDKSTIERLRRLNVNPGGAIPIPLESVANIEIKEGPSEIRRIGQQRSAVILANISGRSLSDASAGVYQALQNLDMPADFTFEITGQNKEMEVSLNSLRLALLLAIFLVYIVMASQFESFLHPFVILFTIPFALIGVILLLWALGISMNIMVFLGLIILAGIVVNNAIVLVDYINQLRRRGIPKNEAIKQAGQARLRPILMTTTTTVLGLLPMALGLGEGAEIRTPMAITVIAGLVSSTVLTLVVIPTVYAVFERGE
ncbi:MAG: efflux RND transporter permease subunit [Calditrichaceae bacterium]|nr:efflux RND transporter permease subunit [Calditrichia bacterium]NUQ40380.1 efflux RND transporter permease subunit [Calditrichaceae bacterium]